MSGSMGIVRRDRAFLPSLHSAPHLDHRSLDADSVLRGVDGGPSQTQQLAAAQAVEHCQSKRALPPVSLDPFQEAPHLGFGPRLGLMLDRQLGHLPGHRHRCRRVAAQLPGRNCIVERRPQHHPDHLDAAT